MPWPWQLFLFSEQLTQYGRPELPLPSGPRAFASLYAFSISWHWLEKCQLMKRKI